MSFAVIYKLCWLNKKTLKQPKAGRVGRGWIGVGGCLCLWTISLCAGVWDFLVILGCSRAYAGYILSVLVLFFLLRSALTASFRNMHLTEQWNLPNGVEFAGPFLCLVKGHRCVRILNMALYNSSGCVCIFLHLILFFLYPFHPIPTPRSPGMNFYLYI